MRKVFFSLVATLAFGSFAMANNVDVETSKKVNIKSNINLIEDVNVVEEVSDCLNQAYDDYEVFYPEANGEDNIDVLNWLVTLHCHWTQMFR